MWISILRATFTLAMSRSYSAGKFDINIEIWLIFVSTSRKKPQLPITGAESVSMVSPPATNGSRDFRYIEALLTTIKAMKCKG